jgi:universal stress protein A
MATIKKIMCPVDFSETSLNAARKAADLARQIDASLLLLHVIDQPSYFLEASGQSSPYLWEDYEQKAQERLQSLAGRLADSAPATEVRVAQGRAPEVIARESQSLRADLVVMGTHGRTGAAHFVLGSVAERVARISPVPVMTVRTP